MIPFLQVAQVAEVVQDSISTVVAEPVAEGMYGNSL